MDAFLVDLRYGIRQLFKEPGSSIAALVTLALGMGASTAIFSVARATILNPLPYSHPEQLVTVSVEENDRGEWESPTPSMADMRDWQGATDIFSAVAGSGSAFRGHITIDTVPERIQVRHLTEDYLAMHGVTPMLGRGFTREDTYPGSTLVALLGHGYWQSRYAGRTDVLGETIRLDDQNATIVGVLPSWFYASTPLSTPLRVAPNMFRRRGSGAVHVEARLRPGVTIEQARERLTARMQNGNATTRPERAVITSRLDSFTAQYQTTVAVFAAAVAMILVIAAVNVAGLLLARGAARHAEFAVRASLGAGRGRLIRQLLTESAALAVTATALGLLIAWLSLGVLEKNLPFTLPPNAPIVIDRTVLLLTLSILVPTIILFSALPALRFSRVDLEAVMARGARRVGSSFSRRVGQLFIAAEIAIAVVLVMGAGLMIRSFIRISSVELGFNPDGLVTMEVMALDRSPEARKTYYDQLADRLRTLSSVSSSGLVDNFVLGGGTAYSSVTIGGRDVNTTVFEASPGYLQTIAARVVSGRLPEPGDAAAADSVVINESAARTMFPQGNAVGGELIRAGEERRRTVAAVIRDLRHRGPLDTRSLGQPQVFYPIEPNQYDMNQPILVVARTSGRTQSVGNDLRELARAIGPPVLIERIRSANEHFGERVVTPRRRMVLLGILGGLGLTLALIGVFGITAYAVTRRTAEIGVRMALGATPRRIVRTILGDSALPIVLGTTVGIAGATMSTEVIKSFLFDTAPDDRLTLAIVAATLAASGSFAALLPALRAARVDPATTLRAE